MTPGSARFRHGGVVSFGESLLLQVHADETNGLFVNRSNHPIEPLLGGLELEVNASFKTRLDATQWRMQCHLSPSFLASRVGIPPPPPGAVLGPKPPTRNEGAHHRFCTNTPVRLLHPDRNSFLTASTNPTKLQPHLLPAIDGDVNHPLSLVSKGLWAFTSLNIFAPSVPVKDSHEVRLLHVVSKRFLGLSSSGDDVELQLEPTESNAWNIEATTFSGDLEGQLIPSEGATLLLWQQHKSGKRYLSNSQRQKDKPIVGSENTGKPGELSFTVCASNGKQDQCAAQSSNPGC